MNIELLEIILISELEYGHPCVHTIGALGAFNEGVEVGAITKKCSKAN